MVTRSTPGTGRCRQPDCAAQLIVPSSAPMRRADLERVQTRYRDAAVAALALHTGAAIVPGVAHPLPDGRCRIVYGPEIAYQATGDYDTDVRAINQQCLRFCEDVIRQQPEHWMWSYKRWKFLPEERRDGYPFYSRYWPM